MSQTITEDPLFSLFLNAGGMDESLLNSMMVPEMQKMDTSDSPRQLASIVPDASMMDAGIVPQASNEQRRSSIGKGIDSKKKKGIVKLGDGLLLHDAPLNLEEERQLKRQRRLVKNREAAQLFRQRQKAYIQDLERKVTELTSHNNDARARIELLSSENKLIKEQLLYLRNFITQAVSFTFPKSGGSSPSGYVGGVPAGLASLALGNMAGISGFPGSVNNMLNSVGSTLSQSNVCQSSMAASSCSSTTPISPSSMTQLPPSLTLSPLSMQQTLPSSISSSASSNLMQRTSSAPTRICTSPRK